MRKRSDRLHVLTLGPRELEAFDMIEQRPGITVAELANAMGLSMQRTWQIVGRLELGRTYASQPLRASRRGYPCRRGEITQRGYGPRGLRSPRSGLDATSSGETGAAATAAGPTT